MSDSDSDFTDMSDSDSKPVAKNSKKKKIIKKKSAKPQMEVSDSENDSDGGSISDEEVTVVAPVPPKKDKSRVAFPVLNPFAVIKNKDIRKKQNKKLKLIKNKEKKAERKQRQQEGGERSRGHTIESLREVDQTTVQNIEGSDNEELRKDLETDDFSEYYSRSYEPKVLICFSDNPCTKTRNFGKELARIIPNSRTVARNKSSVKKMCNSAIREEYTDLVVVNENRRQPNGLLVIHLPNGPTALFKLSNVKITKEIKRSHKEITTHRPEVILTNFSTRLGLNIGRMLGALFHHDPEFRGRRAVTFHNQRDYIFFRHHRYQFASNGERVKLRELGPRFTLKLRSLQDGLFDSKCGDYEWLITNKRHQMESRRRFFL